MSQNRTTDYEMKKQVKNISTYETPVALVGSQFTRNKCIS